MFVYLYNMDRIRSIHPSIHPSTVSISLYIYIYLSICLSIYLPTHLSMCLSIYLPIYLSIYPSNSLSYSIVIFLLTLRIRCAPYLFGIYVHTEPWHQSTILQELCDQVKAILCDRVVDGHVSLLIRAVGVRFTWRKRSKVFNFQEKKGEPLDIMTDREFG